MGNDAFRVVQGPFGRASIFGDFLDLLPYLVASPGSCCGVRRVFFTVLLAGLFVGLFVGGPLPVGWCGLVRIGSGYGGIRCVRIPCMGSSGGAYPNSPLADLAAGFSKFVL